MAAMPVPCQWGQYESGGSDVPSHGAEYAIWRTTRGYQLLLFDLGSAFDVTTRVTAKFVTSEKGSGIDFCKVGITSSPLGKPAWTLAT